MLTYFTSLLALAGCLALPAYPVQAADNQLTDEEKKDGFVLLFNGTDLKGWHRNQEGYGGWKVENGAMCLAKGGSGNLYTDEQYDNFVLKIDFKMGRHCNSGVFLRVGDPKNEVQTGIEVQVLDDSGTKPNRHSCGALYDLVAPSQNVTKPAGEWNSYVITCNKNIITVKENGVKVSEINVDEWDKPGRRPDGTKHKFKKAIKDFPRKGYIGLQDHGGKICYKNIKLKVLK